MRRYRARAWAWASSLLSFWLTIWLLLTPSAGTGQFATAPSRLAGSLVARQATAAVGLLLTAVPASLLALVALPSGVAHALPAGQGRAWAWGLNADGQLGNGGGGSSAIPVEVKSPDGQALLEAVTTVAAGAVHSLALKDDGTLWAWGSNTHGELGDGTTFNRNLPVQVRSADGQGYLRDVVAIAGAWTHSLAVKRDTTVWAWGDNGWGQLGDDSMQSSTVPVQVLGPGGAGFLTGVAAVAGDAAFSLALKTDGTVWAWGRNVDGRLGDGTFTDRHTPVQVQGLTGTVSIGVGEWHGLAVLSNGTAWAWGQNGDYQLGDGTTTNRNVPVQVQGLTDVQAVGGGWQHSLALKNDGTVWAWGGNNAGQLGDGSTTTRPFPVQVLGPAGTDFLTGIVAIAAGYEHNLALKDDGTLWAWGAGGAGQLGNGSTINQLRPVQVRGPTGSEYLLGANKIAAGDYHTLAARAVPVGQAPPGAEHHRPPLFGAERGDPVHTLTGAFAYGRVDLAIAGRGPSPTFARSYYSDETREGPLGPGWTHSYHVRLTSAGDGTGDLILTGPQGRSDRYTHNADGSYTPRPGVLTTLVENADGTYTATHPDQSTWTLRSDGKLMALADRYGNQSALSYNAAGQLTAIGDPAGRGVLTLTYDQATGRLASVSDWMSPPRTVSTPTIRMAVSGRSPTAKAR
ncbi:MAG: hypothetical protein HY331_11590 [Chloroflexi bacterium]|nr:hypothetical protein [Chloroflexota bacterium]